MKLELAKFIVEALESSNGNEYNRPQLEEAYFPDATRGSVAAVIMEQNLFALASAVAIHSRYLDGNPTDEEVELIESIAYLRWDTLGRDRIVIY